MNRSDYQEECIKVYLREEYGDLDACDIEFVNSIKDAFSFGVKCADAMPNPGLVDLSKVWHPAEEEPEFNNPILTEEEDESYYILIRINQCNTWKDYVRTNQVICWAYIEDLLPKKK